MASRSTILFQTQGGLSLFHLLLPKLIMVNGKNKANIDSPISSGTNCFSVFLWKGKYLFKDHHLGVHGDIFELVARMNDLNSKTEFEQVLAITERMVTANIAKIPSEEKLNFANTSNQEQLCLVSLKYSKTFVDKYFMEACSYLEHVPSYPIHLVDSVDVDQKDIFYEFDISNPDASFYAIVIVPDQYYILFNPKTMESFEWGLRPEFYAFGMDSLFKNAYLSNIYLRESVVITNRVEGVLWCEDKQIPCLALLNNEMLLDQYTEQVILSKFSHKYLMFDLLGKGKEQLDRFVSNYKYQVIDTTGGALYELFNSGDEFIDKVFENLHYCGDYEMLGLENPVISFEDTDFKS